MSIGQMALYAHVLSLIIFITGIVYFFYLGRKKRFNRRLAWLMLLLIISILPLNLYPIDNNSLENPFAAVPKTLQAFSVDVNYEDTFSLEPFLKTARPETTETPDQAAPRAKDTASGAETAWNALIIFFMVYKAIIYSIAPILGGVVIYDVFVGISPHARLYLVRKRRLYIFSELNLRSLCLADSIYTEKKCGRRPILVFANCGGDTSNGTGNELKSRVKALRAICLPERLNAGYNLRLVRESVIFLMTCRENGTFDESENLSTLHAILNEDEPIWPVERGCNIFCFTDCAETVESIRAVKRDFDQRHCDCHWGEVVLHVVRDYAQTANTLMERHPLYETLEGKAFDAPLKTLIIGNNAFSREMFKTIFWCGQLLDHPLELAVAYMTEQPAGDRTIFEQWLDAECPELIKSCIRGDECLRASLDGSFNAPYASLCFAEMPPGQLYGDLLSCEIPAFQYGTSKTKALSQFDYILIMAGNDQQNIALLEGLWRQLAYRKTEGNAVDKKIIAVAIESPKLSQLTRLRYNALKEEMDVADVIIFGSVDSRFRWENVFRMGVYAHGNEKLESASDALHSLPGFNASMDDIYDEWSSEARQIHLKYKMFSALNRTMAGADDRSGILRDKLDYCERVRADSSLYGRLSWLEHRRWNAFLRTQGFRRPPHLEDKLSELGMGRCEDIDVDVLKPYAYKNVPARLHPDLVESVCGIRLEPRDMLDLASDMRKLVDAKAGKKLNKRDIKYYDRPDGKYGPVLNRVEVCLCLMDNDFTAEGDAPVSLWKDLEQRYPSIEKCKVVNHPGWYYADSVLALKAGR